MDAEFGSAVAALTERELSRLRTAPRKQVSTLPEVSDGAVITGLFKAAIPALKADAKNLQKVRAANARQQ